MLNRLGTSDSVSWPVFWLTLIAGIIGNFSAVQTGAALWIRILIIVAAQIALFTPLILVRILLLNKATRPHPYIVIAAFILAVLSRALTVIFLNYYFFPQDETTALERILGNFLNVGMVLVVSAYVVNVIRERRYQIAQLESLNAELEQSINTVSSELTSRNDATVDRIRDVLEKELDRLDSDNPSGSLAALHETATYVVRPLSHELAKEMPDVTHVRIATDATATNWGQVLDRIIRGKPFRPVLTAAFMSLEVIAVVATLVGVAAVMIPIPLVQIVLLAAANLIFERLSRNLNVIWRLILALLLAVIVGALVGWGVWYGLSSGPRGWALGIAAATITVVLAIVVSIGSGVTRERDAVIVELTNSARELERSLTRRKQTQWLQNKSLSRALHGPVQTAVNAAAIKIDGALREGNVSAEMIENIRQELLESLDVLGNTDGGVITLDTGIHRIEKTWDGICEVSVSISAGASDQLDSDVIIRSCFIDMVTEAVSNAVRHGQATEVGISAKLEDGELVLDVRDNGSIALVANAPGLGSNLLDDCTSFWSIESTGSGHHLKAVIPTLK